MYVSRTAVVGAWTEPYIERVNGSPTVAIGFLHGWNGAKTDVFPELNDIPNAVVFAMDAGAGYANSAGSYEQMERIRAVIEKVKTDHSLSTVLLVAYSGGMYSALMLMAHSPGLVQGASLWIGITDLATWWEDGAQAAGNRSALEACFNGPPDTPERLAEYRRRSPITTMHRIRNAVITINSGALDTHVPPYQQFDAYRHLRGLAGVNVSMVSHNIGHVFGSAQASIAVSQLNAIISGLGAAPADTLIDRTLGTVIGDMTSFGGIAAAFDGQNVETTVQSAFRIAGPGWVGKTYPSPKKASRVRLYPSDGGFVSSAATGLTVNLRGKNGAAPSSRTDGTLLGSVTSAEKTSGFIEIMSTDKLTSWDHVFVEIIPNATGEDSILAELEIFAPT